MTNRLLAIVLSTPGFLCPVSAGAQWPWGDIPVCTAANDQSQATAIPDGSGGVIAVWADLRNGIYSDIFAQRIVASGRDYWAPNGIPVCTTGGTQVAPVLAPDGAGGAIVTWRDSRAGIPDIYAQRLSSSGSTMWAAGGVEICTAARHQFSPVIAPDGFGGAFIAWTDWRNENYIDLYAQRVDASGTVQWATNGVAITPSEYSVGSIRMIADGAGGAIIAWDGGEALLVQRIDETGAPGWAAGGVALSGHYQELTSDGSGGVFVTVTSAAQGNIYVHWIDTSGAPRWAPAGVLVGAGYRPQIASDGDGGAIVTWHDLNEDIRAERVGTTGVPQWKPGGVPVCVAPGQQSYPLIVSDAMGGAIISWDDKRNGIYEDVYAQQITDSGEPRFAINGIPVATEARYRTQEALVPSQPGAAIVVWKQSFSGNDDLYAQRIGQALTAVGDATPRLSMAIGNHPNPFSERTVVELTMPRESPATVAVFDAAGRAVRTIDLGRLAAGTSRFSFDGLDDRARSLPSGVYFYRVHAGGETATKKMVIAR